jgi:serine/threonine-protein phosphatase 2A regulatory subunit B
MTLIVFEQEEDPSSRSFFSEIISSISDVRFSYDGRYILSRDYLTVKIWDINMERQPIKTIPIHEHLRPRLCDTYENDSIFDKFEVVFSGDAKNVMTGSYNNNFMIYPSDPDKEVEVVLQADKSAFKAKKIGVPTPINSSASPTANGGKKGGSRAGSPGAGQGQRMRKETDADQIDFNKKILHMSWHPFEDSIAIAATNNVSFPPFTRDLSLACSNLLICHSSSSFLRSKPPFRCSATHLWLSWPSNRWRLFR